MYDRYFLPFLPMMMLPMLMRMSHATTSQAPVISYMRWLALLPLALFAVLGQHDYLARAIVRWQAAENLVSRGIPLREIYAGFEWQGWQLYAEGEKVIRARGDYAHVPFPPDVVLDPKYAVMQLTGDEYTEIGSLPYQSWLEGGATEYMLVLKRK